MSTSTAPTSRRPSRAHVRVWPKYHFTSLTPAGPNVRSHVPIRAARAMSCSIGSLAPSHCSDEVHLGRDVVHPPSFGPRTTSPSTPNTVRTLGEIGPAPPQVLPGAGS